MHSLFRFAKATVKRHSALLARLAGVTLLNKRETETFLASNATQLLYNASEAMVLPQVLCAAPHLKQLFQEKPIQTGFAYVWRYENVCGSAKQLRNGSLRMGNKILDLGFGNSTFIRDLANKNKRETRTATLLIAPWSYYWTGYFDYIFFVALSIFQIKQALPPEEFEQAVLCYPLFNSPFEKELCDLLGIKPENLVDSRHTEVHFTSCIVSNNDSWFYPNRQGVLAFKELLSSKLNLTPTSSNRLYIQRATRRKVVNEEALLQLLKNYNFIIVEDMPRSLAEQAALYHNASFIIGPHGASFANILYCQPGTELFELFPNTYMPEYFRYLTQVLGLRYSAYCYGQPVGNEHHHVNDDVFVDLAELEHQLIRVFEQQNFAEAEELLPY